MSTAAAPLLQAATLDDDAWEDLLSFIEERKTWGTEGLLDQRELAEMGTWLAMSMAREFLRH